ncbi:transglutaminase family protein [Aliamphritea spongicola]|uniref:transglutaminase family protein n=1 Tax=Aliamphritea spongicola TaxID=707589 RepID=UPI00196A9AC6|nr:DUF3488 and transglutaminase-like domain-containing protein [Aliamphritea spongicola]MBN3564261.1 DUF3488 domain-containing transglutaminase family protein [Aliamphritea spongicola]
MSLFAHQKTVPKEALPALNARRWIFFSTVLCMLPQALHMPVWMSLLAGVLLVYAGLRLNRGIAQPPRLLKVLAVLVVLTVTALSVLGKSTLLGLVILLVMANTLKLLELRTRRDVWVVVLVNCFIIAAAYLFSTSMLSGAYGVFSIIVLLASLITLHSDSSSLWTVRWQPLKTASVLLLQALPLAVLIFLIFPRIGPLWSLELATPSARTGLSDSLAPGEISNLLRSDEMAFRVSFSGDPVPEQMRYWRAMTFDHFDGQRWQIDDAELQRQLPDTAYEGDYQVIAEPASSAWLIALTPVSRGTGGLKLFPDGTVRAPEPLQQRFTYNLPLQGDTRETLSTADRRRYLQVPEGNPRARAQVDQWLAEGLTQQQILAAILQQYRQHFSYTLSPARLQGHRVDEFFFSTREGFCEHFASATGLMLRMAGIPTRLVGGYLGGEWNPYSEYLLIRQRDAHAWVEAWLDGRWQRIDPTSAVAPERVLDGIEELLQQSPGYLADQPLSMVRLEQQFALLAELRLRYQSLNYSWHRWVLGYDSRQEDLLKNWLGTLDYLKSVLLVLLPVTLLLVVIGWWLLRPRPRYRDQISLDAEYLSDRLSRKQPELARAAGETLQQYCRRVAAVFPDRADALMAWADAAGQAQYDVESGANMKLYRRRLKHLKRQL